MVLPNGPSVDSALLLVHAVARRRASPQASPPMVTQFTSMLSVLSLGSGRLWPGVADSAERREIQPATDTGCAGIFRHRQGLVTGAR